MTVFLKGRKLWRYVTGSISKPVPNPKSKATAAEDASKTAVTTDDYEECLEEWESIQSKILSWFINTSIPSIHNLLPRLETAEAAWKFLADRYNCTNDSSLEFHIESKLYRMCQETVCSKDIELFVTYRDRRKFMHFMMGLRENFEPTRASLLSRSLTPSLDAAVKELISEENRRLTHHMSSSDHVLATLSPQPPISAFTAPPRIKFGRPTSQSSKGTRCEFCRAKGHDISVCRKLQKFVQEQNKASLPRAAAVCPSDPSVPTDPSLASSLITVDIEAVVQQVLSRTSIALSVASGVDLLFTNHGVDVQDPRTGQVLRTSRKVGRMFEVKDLKIPSQVVSAAATIATLSLDLWHARLDHPSLSCLQLLASQDSHGTLPQQFYPYISQQNGRAERKHRHILDVVCTVLISASLPERFWGEAALTAVYTINHIPSPTTHNKSPFEFFYGQTPDYSSFRVFGCACFVALPLHERTKF
ncbi:uncharacterized protein LOC142606377 [Castanea sativa]|uniref:uncharacterized protein LOC142606377 n=1 Tax=Castanea sativa TaxID=21020 RepID=UPI003F6510D5